MALIQHSIYRRTRDEMPAEGETKASNMKVQSPTWTNPAENIADDNGHVSEIRLERMALGPAGRRRQP